MTPRKREHPDEKDHFKRVSRDRILALELAQIEEEERRLVLELLDVFADVSTPELSDDEEVNVVSIERPVVPAVVSLVPQALLEIMLEAVSEPISSATYSSLYLRDVYKNCSARKLRMLRRTARNCQNFDQVSFDRELGRIRDLYIEDGDRSGLYELVALYCVLHPDEVKPEEEVVSDADLSSDCSESTDHGEDDEDGAAGLNQLISISV
jgi:hypothetical protein